VILGAGYGTRAYRLPQLVGIPICEVDLPTNIARKAAALQRCFGRVPPGVTLLPVDFAHGRFGQDGQAMYGAEPDYQYFVVKQGLWKFGRYPEEVEGFLAEYGWGECEPVGPDEDADRYLEPARRTLTASEIERALYAERADGLSGYLTNWPMSA